MDLCRTARRLAVALLVPMAAAAQIPATQWGARAITGSPTDGAPSFAVTATPVRRR